MTSFVANVTVAGNVEAGDFAIHIAQIPAEPPSPPGPWEPPPWLLNDTAVVAALPPFARPAYLTPVRDPVFGSTITRIAGDPGTPIGSLAGTAWGDVARHHYNLSQAWNCDQSLLYLDTNSGPQASGGRGVFLDGESYAPLFMQNARPSGSDVRWHPTEPAVLYYAHRGVIGTWNPQTDETRVIRDFGGDYSGLTFGPWKGQFSEDGDVVMLTGQRAGSDIAFRYQLSTDEKGRDFPVETWGGGQRFDTARISPRGQRILWNYSPATVVITDLDGNVVQTLATNRISHGDVTVDENGSEVLVGRVNSGSGGDGPSGRVSKFRLSDGVRTGLTDGGWCSHTSCREVGRRWCVADAFDRRPQHPPYHGELLLIALDGSSGVFRLCHHRNGPTPDYVSQCQASLSPDAGRVIYASSWEATGDAPRPVSAYIVDYRK